MPIRMPPNPAQVETAFHKTHQVIWEKIDFPVKESFEEQYIRVLHYYRAAGHFVYDLDSRLYPAISQRLIELIGTPSNPKIKDGGDVALSDCEEVDRVYYHFGGFLSAARTAMELMPDLLLVGEDLPADGDGPPRAVTLLKEGKLAGLVSIDFEKRLVQDWNEWGKKLADYRNCIVHHRHFFLSHEVVAGFSENDLAMRCPIPDNPEAGPRGEFSFSRNLDVLGYSISALSQLGWLLHDTLGEIEKKWQSKPDLPIDPTWVDRTYITKLDEVLNPKDLKPD